MKRHLFALSMVVVLTACAQNQPQNLSEKQVVAQKEPPKIDKAINKKVDVISTFSNKNVTIFPLTGSTMPHESRLNEYRGVLNNTTAGGYTVFDQSVTVFPVEGVMSSGRPSYLPEYSVPKYAAQYQSRKIRENFANKNSIPLLPSPSSPNVEATPLTLTPAAPIDQGAALRRSPPILTSYD